MPRPAALAILLALATCAPTLQGGTALPTDQTFEVAVTGAGGEARLIPARLCRPDRPGPARLVVIAHGSPASAADRPRMTLGSCREEAVRWFTTRGYAVALSLRRGYGSAGGEWSESYGPCDQARYAEAGRETARDIDATVQAATGLPGIRPDGAVVVGQSAGGWGTIAYDAQPHPRVAAMIVMAGGRGGHQDDLPNRNCHPDRLAVAAGQLGATATTPMLWIYAANDSFFGPAIATALHQAFTEAGGKAELLQPGPFGRDGHRLFFGQGGSLIWGPLIQPYLSRMGVAA